MEFTVLEVAGRDAIRLLSEQRSRWPTTGQYPFLIGDAEELSRIKEGAEFDKQEPAAIVRASFDVKTANWIAGRRKEAEQFEFSPEELAGEWPDEVAEKGSICLHKDLLTSAIKPEVFIGLAKIETPWQLPAVLQWGGWNECPGPEVHCAFHRQWQEKYGAEITGVSGDIVECAVSRPPTDRDAATALAWEQYWYCTDIVDQGCDSVLNLAATLLRSPYWYFWWD